MSDSSLSDSLLTLMSELIWSKVDGLTQSNFSQIFPPQLPMTDFISLVLPFLLNKLYHAFQSMLFDSFAKISPLKK